MQADRARLWVIDGGKALRRAITVCFGRLALVQRCQEHKRRNVLEHLPQAMQLGTGKAMRQAWDGHDAMVAAERLQALANSLQAQHPGAAASLREGLAETLTVQGLGITEALYRTLRTTNPIENLNGAIARYTRNVKRWKDASMARRWVASALNDAKGRFRRLRGHRDMKTLIAALNSVVVHGEPIGSALALVIFLGHTQGTQFGVPVGLERVGDESIHRVDLHVAAPRLVGLVLCMLDQAVPQAVSLVEPSADLLLHGKRQLQGHRRERLDEQLANGGIDVGADDALARRVAQALAAAEAHLVGSEPAAAAVVVVHVHAVAAQPAQRTALQ